MNVKYRIILLERTNLSKLTNKSWSATLTNSESSFSACKTALLLQKGLAIKEKKRNKRWKAVKHKICKAPLAISGNDLRIKEEKRYEPYTTQIDEYCTGYGFASE